MISNIGKLDTIGKKILSWVWTRYHYLKIRICLTRIYLQSFLLHIIVYQQYHLEEEDEFSRMAPSLAIKTGWKPSFHVKDSAASALAPLLSNPHIWAIAEVHHFRPF